jgi:hypothetical protein
MDKDGFAIFLKKGGRSKSAIKTITEFAENFHTYLIKSEMTNLHNITTDDLDTYIEYLESTPKYSPNKDLWALFYYFDFLSLDSLKSHSSKLRGQRIKRTPFRIRDFRGIDLNIVSKLEDIGVVNVNQLLKTGKTKDARKNLAEKTKIPTHIILELVKLSDLTRIGGLKSIRARLYYDAGIETPEVLAQWNDDELITYLRNWVKENNFEGIAPLPKEVKNAVKTAKSLNKIVEY